MPFSSTHISSDIGHFKPGQEYFSSGIVRVFWTSVSIHMALGSFYSHRSCQIHQKVNLKLNQKLQGSTSMLWPAIICFPQCSSHSPGCQQAFRLTDIQHDPGQLYFSLVCLVLSKCLMDFPPCTDPHVVASLKNKLFTNGTLNCFLFLVSALFQIISAVFSY